MQDIKDLIGERLTWSVRAVLILFLSHGILKADKAKEMVSPAVHIADLMAKKFGDYWTWTQVRAENGFISGRNASLGGQMDTGE